MLTVGLSGSLVDAVVLGVSVCIVRGGGVGVSDCEFLCCSERRAERANDDSAYTTTARTANIAGLFSRKALPITKTMPMTARIRERRPNPDTESSSGTWLESLALDASAALTDKALKYSGALMLSDAEDRVLTSTAPAATDQIKQKASNTWNSTIARVIRVVTIRSFHIRSDYLQG